MHPSVILVVPTLDIGGAERVVCLLARELVAAGVSTRVLALQGGPFEQVLRDASVAFDILHVRSKRDFLSSGRMHRYFDAHQPGIVHAHMMRALWMSKVALRRRHATKVVTTFHGLSSALRFKAPFRGRLMAAAEGVMARRSVDGCVAVSEEIRRDLIARGVPPEGVRVIYNALDHAGGSALTSTEKLDVRRRLSVPVGAPLIGVLGRLITLKGHHVLIRALPIVHRSFPSAHVLIIGDGPERAALTALADGLGVRGSVTFAGAVVSPHNLVAACDVFAHPSLEGAFGLAGMEAMASGVPVVASNLAATPELVTPDVMGLLVTPDSAESLAAGLVALLQDPARARRLADTARQVIADRFGPARFLREHLELYDAVRR